MTKEHFQDAIKDKKHTKLAWFLKTVAWNKTIYF